MKKPLIPTLAIAALVTLGACSKGGDETKTADTMTTKGMDTVSVPTAVPTTDTVVKTTTTSTDTVKGKVNDDSAKKAAAMKKKP